MYPEIVSIGPFTIYSYGLMLGIAFITASFILNGEFGRKNLDPNYATEVTFIAILFGIVGSKLFHLFENWGEFLRDPIGMAFSPGGLTFYGGLIIATLAIYISSKRKKIPFLYVADSAAPSLALAYGIGRIGCHLAGDGDYGIPTTLAWGTNYENGIVKPSQMFSGSEYASGFTNGILPDNTLLHPTPIYEFLGAVLIFFILWNFRKKDWADGRLFMLYLIFSGMARFSVEFIRLNPRFLFGLSEAQIISVVLFTIGIGASVYYSFDKSLPKYRPALPKAQSEKKKKPK